MILDDIKDKLEAIDPVVFYGMADDSIRETVWDYTVFNRVSVKPSTNKTAATDYFDVALIRENFIPDGLDIEVIDSLCTLPGVRLAGSDATFDYIKKPGTNTVVEMLVIHFLRARK